MKAIYLLFITTVFSLPSFDALHSFWTYSLPDDKGCVAEFHIISYFDSIDTTNDEHLKFSYIEVESKGWYISCMLHNGEVMHWGCTIKNDDDDVKNVMEGELVHSYPDGANTIYIV